MACARLGPAAAFIDRQRGQAAACEENRLTRARQVTTTGRPAFAIAELLDFLQRRSEDVGPVAVVNNEDQTDWARDPRAVPVDGHMAHAAYAFHSSPYDAACVLVCEMHRSRGWTAWKFGRGEAPVEVGASLGDFPLARIYGVLTEALGFQTTRDEHLVEALARAGRDTHPRLAELIALTDDGVRLAPSFADEVRAAATASDAAIKDVAASVQRRLGECLAALLQRLAVKPAPGALCLSGGLFFNTYFTTVAATCGAFEHVHVPPHPGRNGTAVGAALLAVPASARLPILASPYLGPAYNDQSIKETLENCKLSFDLQREDRVMDEVRRALSRGRLVGWFHGRLEWGPRALGHRSVLADPLATHTLDNLNGFLKRRPAHRTYGVSVPLSALDALFDGPPASPFMQFDYRPRDPERFRTILPPGVETLRVHTVDASEPRFLRLLELWGDKTGTPVLVNTSFNGFHEPLVCSPRDAIRVFYGTGLDLLALEDFVVRK
jgi:carbamoyltransferase